jgi:hypothetical protein
MIAWLGKHKYPLMVTAFFIVVILFLWVLFKSLQKDHSLDLVKQELKYKEKERVEIQKEREYWVGIVKSQDENIRSLIQKDSLLIGNVGKVNNQLDNLSKKANDKNKAINNFGSNDLLQYFNSLPKQSD